MGQWQVLSALYPHRTPPGAGGYTASRAEFGLGDPGSSLDSMISQLGDAGMGFPVSSSAKWER